MDPDLPLIEAIKAGDDSALDQLMERHREPLYHFAYRYLRDETLARDVVQEAFVRAYFQAAKFEPRSLVKTWLYAIAFNLCRDQGRKLAKRHREVSLNAPARHEQRPPELADPGPSPGDLAGQRNRFAVLQHAIDRLPAKLKDALVLFALEELSQREVAAILGTSPKAVETRVYHAKEKLRRWLMDAL